MKMSDFIKACTTLKEEAGDLEVVFDNDLDVPARIRLLDTDGEESLFVVTE